MTHSWTSAAPAKACSGSGLPRQRGQTAFAGAVLGEALLDEEARRETGAELGPCQRLDVAIVEAHGEAVRREQPRPTGAGEAGAGHDHDLRHDRLSNRSSVVPTSMRSPFCSVACLTSRRLTRVPLVEPRSRMR